MNRRFFLRSLPLLSSSIPHRLWGDENELIPMIHDIHSLLLPDQTRLVITLDGPCNTAVSDSNNGRIVLPGTLYLPIEDTMKFNKGPLRRMHIVTPPDELFTTYIQLDTTPGSTFSVTTPSPSNRVIIDIYGSIGARPDNAFEKKYSDLQERADQELKNHSLHDRAHDLNLRLKRIVIDPGHGGHDPGAVGLQGTKEKDITLILGRRLADSLKAKAGLDVHLTRTADYYLNLSDRTATANQYRADLFISIHCNAAENRKARGSETYFCSENASDAEAARVAQYENSFADDEDHTFSESFVDVEYALFKLRRNLLWNDSGRLARFVQEEFARSLPVKDRGVRSANFFVLRKAAMPSMLLETAFISNPDEEKLLTKDSFQQLVVDSVVRRLDPFLS